MRIWVDADACPGVIKEILFKAAERTEVEVTLVANQPVRAHVALRQVPSGAPRVRRSRQRDRQAVERLYLVITSDIPLAAEVIDKGGHALAPRGERFSTDTIKARLTMRDFMDTLRASGVNTGGPPALSQSGRRAFANELDKFLARHASGSRPARHPPLPRRRFGPAIPGPHAGSWPDRRR